jgi:hypothetical protein
MTTFDDRENAFENLYAHDAEMQFKAEARRNKLYAKSVVIEDLKEAGDDDVYRKVAGDLDAKGAGIPEAELRGQMKKLLIEAKAQIVGEAGP